MMEKRPNVCQGCLDCHGLTEEVLRLLRHKRCGTMFDFQTGGPTVSPLLLMVGPASGPMWLCGVDESQV